MRAKLKKTVVLVGMMGSGKTAIGKALAAHLEVPFRDSDAEIELAAKRSIAGIFARDGEPFFRDREAEVIKRLLGERPGVLSTGGGAFLAERNRAAISEQGVSLWLDADIDLLWSRVKHKDTRPLLRTADPRKTLSEIFETRVPIYEMADLKVVTRAGNSIEATTQDVIDVLCARADVLSIET